MKGFRAKIFQKLVQKAVKQRDETTEIFASTYVDIIRKKDLGVKAQKYRKQINSEYIYYTESYFKMIEYLYHHFGVRQMILKKGSEEESLKTEIDFKLKLKDIIKENKVKMFDMFRYNQLIKKWWILSSILEHYYLPLFKLKQLNMNKTYYQDIDFQIEFDRLKSNEYLIEDFTFLQKMGDDNPNK